MASRNQIERIKERLRKETGTVYKSHADKIRYALAFPNTYYIGMSNLGFQTIYKLLNDRDDSVCERVFIPDTNDMPEFIGTNHPLITLESQTPVNQFDVLAFSLSYELDYPNVIKLLTMSGLDPLADDRMVNGHQPLVIAGGPAATFNPEPMAPFIDLFVIGEAEDVLLEIADILNDHLSDDRVELLERLARIEGVYIPRFYNPQYGPDGTISNVKVSHGAHHRVRRRWVRDIASRPAVTSILTPETEFSSMVLTEVARGCGRQCRFCVAGYAYLPPRSASPDAVLEGISKAPQEPGRAPRVGLMSASVFDHPGSLVICQSLLENSRHFSISSTRADTLNSDIVDALRKGGHETLTIAPEAGSERLRLVINKVMNNDDIRHAATVAWEGGYKKLKLYFIIGLPTETNEDIESLCVLVTEIAGMYKWHKVSVSASCFIPKPCTPFQWAPMEDEKVLKTKVDHIRKTLRQVKHVEVFGESPREAIVQGVLARGDRRLQDALIAAAGENTSWRAAFREGNIDPAFYTHRNRDKDEILPWDHIDLGVKKDYLWKEYQRALEAGTTNPCLTGICRRCGVCDDQSA
ncbi:MAG: TIGR03960 family B12-binding radical SAM protein [Armatimonadota bacterium]